MHETAAEYWSYLEGVETPEQYDCFATYRDMGPRRTIAKAARVHRRPAAALHTWAHHCSWADRARAFDEEQARVRDALLVERRTVVNAAWADRRALLLDGLEAIAETGIEQLFYNLNNGRASLRPNELRLLIETLAKYQNLANGDATEKIDFGLDYSKLTDEDMAKLEEAARLQELAKNT